MIRINLLPPDKKKLVQKKKRTKQRVKTEGELSSAEKLPIIIGIALTVLVLLIGGYLFWSMNNKIDTLNNEKKTNTAKIADLDKKLKDIETLNKLISDTNQRQGLIVSLRENQSLPIRVLDELNNTIPESIWLEGMTILGDKIDIDGSGLSYADVVVFINSLKGTKIFKNVELRNAKEKTFEKEKVYGFKVTTEINKI